MLSLAIQTKLSTPNLDSTSKGTRIPSHQTSHQLSTYNSFIICKSKSTDHICQIRIKDYITKSQNGIKPKIFFCSHIRGTILIAVQRAASELQITAKIPPFAEHLVSKPRNFWPLVSRCNLNHGGQDTHGVKFNSLVLAALRNLSNMYSARRSDMVR
ncbi:Ff.00g065770.m01.CDS01 [Fusarium sp. VM40]|nr:Ff.00g065770.m01.CDS01 [Fusarium sp. VM40]